MLELTQRKGFLFDMDGVLFDSMPYHAKAWHDTFADFGIAFSEYQVYLQEGSTGAKTVNDVFLAQKHRLATDEEVQAIYERKCERFKACGQTVPMPYALQVLERVREHGWKVGLVTGSGQRSLLGTLEHYYPGFFAADNMVTAFDVTHGKPDPEPYLKGMRKLGLQPGETVVVENAPLGVRAGKAAGAYVIAVNTGILTENDLAVAGADVVLGSMSELWRQLA
ncbi:MAG: HAD-IA family hydrolase [Paludibacteraceae bacterium]|nr:HAD-IA family hydrolase [Paludibacteraceae bacterium]